MDILPLPVWIGFIGATLALLAMPGPVAMLLLGTVAGHGQRKALYAIPGVMLGDFVAMTLSLLGAGALLAASAALFTTLKLAGAAYLVWLGITVWRSNLSLSPTADQSPVSDCSHPDARASSAWGIGRTAFLVTAFNPKDILFFVAFLPQFIDSSAPVLPQASLLVATFLMLVAVSTATWIYLGALLMNRFRKPAQLRLANRIGGSWLIGAGLLTATSR